MNLINKDTIVALATPPGIGALHIIRMSGSKSINILKKVIYCQNNQIDYEKAKRIIGFFAADNIENSKTQIIDQVVVHIYRAPNSYSGEDMIEINCHGSPYIVDQIIKTLIKEGARLAEAGEFTRRAFLNGKLDLVQAEAISDLIQAQTSVTEEKCIENLRGKLSEQIKQLQEEIKKLCAIMELDLDFSEEDIDLDRKKILEDFEHIEKKITILCNSFRYGKIIQEGFRVVIVGRPNVGKSSLMNRLIKYKRAIVTSTPGTTRDTIEEPINLGGYLVRVSDTAGIRKHQDHIEEEGIKQTKRMMRQADLFIILLDISARLTPDDEEIIQMAKVYRNAEKMIVLNKIDLKKELKSQNIIEKYGQWDCIEISCKTGLGIKNLEKKIIHYIQKKKSEGMIITKLRYLTALKKADKSIKIAKKSLIENLSTEFIIFDLKEAMNYLGEITGEVTNEDILNEIFASFCIGK